jgi:hypothetical protein
MSGIKLALLPAQVKNSSPLHGVEFRLHDCDPEGEGGVKMKVPASILKIRRKSSWQHCQQKG